MEAVNPLPPPPPPPPPTSGLSAQPPTQTSPRAALKDSSVKRTSPRSGAMGFNVVNHVGHTGHRDAIASKRTNSSKNNTATTTITTTRILPAPAAPATERRSHERKASISRARKEAEAEVNHKWDITPDGGSAGREGRQFTVSNVGNNGRIYLRPTIRPANQRYPQPQFTFPITPPSTAGLDVFTQTKVNEDQSSELHTSQWTPTPAASPFSNTHTYFNLRDLEQRPIKHRRALSDSTVQTANETNPAQESESGTFKIVISKPGDEQRPRTMEDLDAYPGQLLDINIPSWKLGTPRFTGHGTPIIRGSSYAPTEEFRMSSVSLVNRSQGEVNSSHHELGLNSRQASSLVVPMLRFSRAASTVSSSLASPRTIKPAHPAYMSNLRIEPAMFDDLTFKPACDDRVLVRYSPATGAVTAATPPRLVAEITSPSFLDYELISDFFLTFRAFLEPADLLRMLIARLRWALNRSDETGMVVRVRTFVALRHWILNYFMDDFVVDYDLRVTFCGLLNDFVDELSQSTQASKVEMKILGELKKCWRRVCAHYWDGPEFDDSLGADVPIAPGGIAGHRDPDLNPTFWERDDAELSNLETMMSFTKKSSSRTSLVAGPSRAGHLDDMIVSDERPITPENRIIRDVDGGDDKSNSPNSITSLDIVSCSFPNKALRAAQSNQTQQLTAHPVATSPLHNTSGPVATTPRALVGKRVRPNPNHKRNNSLTDSLREHGSDKVSFKDQEFLMTVPYAGSLVRGNLLPPGQAIVDVEPPEFMNDMQRQTTVLTPESQRMLKEKIPVAAMSGTGMKKLIGNVRRALSTRHQGLPLAHGNMLNMTALDPGGTTTNRQQGNSLMPSRYRRQGNRPPVRIDLLGAESAEDFKTAVREEAAAEAERRMPEFDSSSGPPATGKIDYSAYMDSSMFDGLRGKGKRPASDMGMTSGSKSIVIVDATTPYDLPGMHRTPLLSPGSIDGFTEFSRPTGADPTPPNTPPAQPSSGGTPRRSSCLIRPSLSQDPLPPFNPDLAVLASAATARVSEDRPRNSMSTAHRSSRPRPPISYRFSHRRNQSTRTHQSLNSILHRRHNSFSGGAAPSTVRSFDATTTYSETSVLADDTAVPMPQPLRVLRRRPGGDLRAARNVEDLAVDHLELRKSRSVGSLTTYTDSIRSSYMQSPGVDSFGRAEVGSAEYSRQRSQVFSLGQLAEKGPKQDLSLFSTHSSKPVMRPSFEAEAQKLAQIPDDDDDGGIESALLKLEGKFDKAAVRFSPVPKPTVAIPNKQEADLNRPSVTFGEGAPEVDEEEKQDHRHQHVVAEEGLVHDVEYLMEDEADSIVLRNDRPITESTEVKSFLSDGSQGSYSSTPILDRGGTDEPRSRTVTKTWTDMSVFQGSDDDATPEEEKGVYLFDDVDSQHPSYELIKKTESIEKIKPGDTAPSVKEHESFLLDDDTDLSSELSADGPEEFDDDFLPMMKLPSHPLSESVPKPKRNPPSPPITLVQALDMSPPDLVEVPELHEHQLWAEKPLPPTPETTPTDPYQPGSPDDQADANEALRSAPKPDDAGARKFSVHLPFTLAYDSEILAQQFTLIEKDALNEIDWKELIDMNWKHTVCNDSRSWVDFLRNSDARGVEIVIARFNLMVKWAISEIVLTQHIEERVRCIIKYIHIATHCRRYRNFATLAQLTIALSSNEISRLSQTWSMVPAQDLKALRDLEALVTPMRNFYNLRAEMEMGSDLGCIPFVGIYTHDLLYNAQRPSEIAGSPTTPPLVNFERCRIAATVVKTLLRLLEASTKYKFQPIEGITERCLWMSALSDEDIRRHSETLE